MVPDIRKVHELQAQLPTLEKAIAAETTTLPGAFRRSIETSSNTVQSLQGRLATRCRKPSS